METGGRVATIAADVVFFYVVFVRRVLCSKVIYCCIRCTIIIKNMDAVVVGQP